MKSDELDQLLHDYAQQPVPPLLASTSGVWRAKEERRRRGAWRARIFPVLDWQELLAEPRLATAMVALALMTGVLPVAAAKAAEEPLLARRSLYLDVFTTRPPGLPATLLASARTR